MQDDKLKNTVPEGFEQVELKPIGDRVIMSVDITLSKGVAKGEGFDLWYTMYDFNKMHAIARIRSITGMGLKELNEKIHYPPILLKEGLSITELNQFVARYESDSIKYSFKE